MPPVECREKKEGQEIDRNRICIITPFPPLIGGHVDSYYMFEVPPPPMKLVLPYWLGHSTPLPLETIKAVK